MDSYKLIDTYKPGTDGIEVRHSVQTDTYAVLNPRWNTRLSTKEGRNTFRRWAEDHFSCVVGVNVKRGLKSNRYYFQIHSC
jgi:hypothetical protein